MSYSDRDCQGESQAVQMDLELPGGCGTVSPQWLVKCDNTIGSLDPVMRDEATEMDTGDSMAQRNADD